MRKTAYQILNEAQKLIEKGWTQKAALEYHGKVPHYCPLGAIGAVVGHDRRIACDGSGKRVGDALRSVINNSSIIEWNDDPKRRKTHVIRAFREAKKLLKK